MKIPIANRILFLLSVLLILLLLRRGYDRSLQYRLFASLRRHDLASVQSVLKQGVNPNCKNENGDTPLEIAMTPQDERIVREIIFAGADVVAEDRKGFTLLTYATRWDDTELVRFLLDKGVNPNEKMNYILGGNALHVAAGNGNDAIAELLLQRGTDPNGTQIGGMTPLMTAARSGHIEIVQILIRHGAGVNAEANGVTALSWAVAAKHPSIVKLLLANGAKADAKSALAIEQAEIEGQPYQENLLLAAIRNNDSETVALLLRYGADVGSRAVTGQTAFELARDSKSDPRIVALLKSTGTVRP